MLTVIIPTRESERTLVQTLSPLVAGATAGLIAQVIVADGGSRDATAEVAEIAGCVFLRGEGPVGARLKAAADLAKTPWLLFLRPGTILDAGWLETVDTFMRSEGEAASFRRAAGGGFVRRLLRPRVHPGQGLLIRKRAYDAAGGHPDGEDAEFAVLRKLGRIALLPANIRAPNMAEPYILRPPRIGDLGWIVSRHAELYWQEYKWGEPFEGLCAQIVADFANTNDPTRERCWIAEMNGENVGCVMLVKDTDDIARLRLLLVDPRARGLGLGARLVDECVRFARAAGYKSVTLWTHSVLLGARHIYEQSGFKLTSSEPRHTWGQDVVAEFWDLEL